MNRTADPSTGAALAVVLIGTWMGTLGNSMVSIALPTLKDHFGVPLTSVVWSITLYTLTFSVLIPVFGVLGPRIGLKRMYLGGIGLVCLGSLASVLATSFWLFLIARILTGIGIATVLPTVMGLIATRIPRESQGRATGYWALVNSLGHALGPILGGFCLAWFGWPSIFLVNLPLGMLSFALGIFLLPETGRSASAPFDLPGALAATALIFSIMLAISQTATAGNASPLPTVLWLVALVSLAFIIIYEQKRPSPFVDLRLFTNRRYLAAIAAISMQAFVQFGLLVSLPVFLIEVRMLDKQVAGLVVMAMTLTMAALSQISGRLADRWGSRGVCMVGAGLVAAAAISILWGSNYALAGAVWGLFLFSLFLFGLGFGFVQSSATVAVIQVVAPEKAGAATGFFHMIRFAIASLGSTVIGIFLEKNSAGLSAGFYQSFWLILAIALVTLPLTLWLPAKIRTTPAMEKLGGEM
jgi:EmrB/QacA subfamily drug resistance transporter